MKRSLLLLQCLLLSFSVSALAAQDGHNCQAKSEQVKPEGREAFLKSCLAQASSPANVKEVTQQNKQASCQQNAKNMKLDGNKKSDYINTCMNKNEAAVEAKKVDAQAPALAQAAQAPKAAAKTAAAPRKEAAKKEGVASKQAAAPKHAKKAKEPANKKQAKQD